MKSQIFYFDHNATTPVEPEVKKAMEPFWGEFYGNPSSLHQMGISVKRHLKEARREVASFLGAEDENEIIFTSGGTESNHAAFRSALWNVKGKRQIVTTAVEHSSVLKLAKALEEEGVKINYAPVLREGDLDSSKLLTETNDETALVSVMMANNETGVIFPIAEIGEKLRQKGILFHVDAVQGVGKISISLKSLTLDFLSLSGHKIGGPKGIGALFVRKGVPFRPFIFGGAQERARRAGTENVPGIVGLGAACRRLQKNLSAEILKIQVVRDYFEKKVFQLVPSVAINGNRNNRLPNTSNLAFEGVDSEALLILMDEAGICASSGSACISGAHEPSHVLKAMGLSRERAKSSIRFSFGHQNTSNEIDEAVRLIQGFVGRLRQIDLKEQHPHF